MTTGFDPERLLAALPYRPIPRVPGLLDGFTPPPWRWPPLGPYNGFTGQERVATWQLSTWLRRKGLLRLAPCCDLCGGKDRLGLHSEDYTDIERALTLCAGCHMALHKRFRVPEKWATLKGKGVGAQEWARALSASPYDLSRWLQHQGRRTDPLCRLELGA